jgi:hypothetical protein
MISPVLALLAVLGATQSARADLEIALQEAGVNGGARTVVGTGSAFTSASFTGTYGDFTVTIFGGAATNGANLSQLLSSTTSVTNNNGSTHTLHLWVTETDYTLPAGTQLSVESGLGGSVSTGTLTMSNIYQAWADKNNGLFGTTDFSNGLQTATANNSTFDTGSAVGTFTRGAGNYSVTSEANFTMSAGATANFSAHVKLSPTPAPAGLVLALSGLPLLGIACWRRRRKGSEPRPVT